MTDIAAGLRIGIEKVLRPMIPKGASCALVDFPRSANVGDSAIWLGERRWLDAAGVDVVDASVSGRSYNRERLAARVRDDLILLHGGGSVGDTWPASQAFREMIISDFPNNRIIQLPQTVFFWKAESLARAQAVFGSHSDFTLLVRDQRSLDFSRQHFPVDSLLCPDMAFALDLNTRRATPNRGTLWLMRTDHEGLDMHAVEEQQTTDWIDDYPGGRGQAATRALVTCERLIGRLIRAGVAPYGIARRLQEPIYDQLASNRLSRGINLLSSNVLVTDRLHGHILAVMLEIPHVVLDNSYGKVRAFYETWTSSSPVAHWADSISQAQDVAAGLLAELSS